MEGGKATGPSLLSRDEIIGRIFDVNPESRLYVVPLLTEGQVGNGTLDVRLGTEFIVSRRTRYAGLDPLQEQAPSSRERRSFRERLGEYQERITLRIGKSLTLHPQQFALGSSMEYVRLPNDLGAYVVGRSSWGRLGLVIATATMIHPGFFGAVTLELSNVGDAPIALYPGLRIAQLALHTAGSGAAESRAGPSRYSGLTGPIGTSLYDDPDLQVIQHIGNVEG